MDDMNEILIHALASRIKAEDSDMTVEQVPVPYQEKVQELLLE